VIFDTQEFDSLNEKYVAIVAERDGFVKNSGALEEVKQGKASVEQKHAVIIKKSAVFETMNGVLTIENERKMREVHDLNEQVLSLQRDVKSNGVLLEVYMRENKEFKAKIEQLESHPQWCMARMGEAKRVSSLFVQLIVWVANIWNAERGGAGVRKSTGVQKFLLWSIFQELISWAVSWSGCLGTLIGSSSSNCGSKVRQRRRAEVFGSLLFPCRAAAE
jgi:hypothetical protein